MSVKVKIIRFFHLPGQAHGVAVPRIKVYMFAYNSIDKRRRRTL